MATIESIKADIRRLVGSMTHTDREGLALDLAGVASGEKCQFLRCDKNTLTAWFPKEAPRVLALADVPGHGGKTLRASVTPAQQAGRTPFDERQQRFLEELGRRKDMTFSEYKQFCDEYDNGPEAA